ncbi:hypothetical protein L2Y94_00110 [Luteibacter aegosomatis]|uniref:hypothetical protein n=1 Tax=Luteibacter aegosomatis TaxID=2911537 RepID=UPI001FFB0D7A|nr:hypothetical protein [Luteibacter aegosomatis]UPG85801.1 hypothetical protein L2Y94_00110 [Luteibacter aegosomatis]
MVIAAAFARRDDGCLFHPVIAEGSRDGGDMSNAFRLKGTGSEGFSMEMSRTLIDQIQWLRVALYLVVGPLLIGQVCSYLKARYPRAGDYTRKINHIGIMIVTAPILAVLPDAQLLPSVLVASAVQVAIYVVAANSTQPLLHAVAFHSLRVTDEPRSRLFFLLPMISFNVALAVSVLLYSMTLVKIAFFTVALGDGLAEPAGFLLGKGNRFQVTDKVWRGSNTKSIAGCLTVLIFAFATAMVFLGAQQPIEPRLLLLCASYAIACTALEALSPRGLDNMVLIIFAPLAMMGLMAIL